VFLTGRARGTVHRRQEATKENHGDQDPGQRHALEEVEGVSSKPVRPSSRSSFILFYFFKHIFIDFREEGRGRKREKHQ
jgi:hypothetical protein